MVERRKRTEGEREREIEEKLWKEKDYILKKKKFSNVETPWNSSSSLVPNQRNRRKKSIRNRISKSGVSFVDGFSTNLEKH